MDSSRLIASITVALDKLQYRKEQSISPSDEMESEIMSPSDEMESEFMILEFMSRGLRVVRTFLLCSTLLNEDTSDILCSQKQMMMKQDNSRMREDLVSLSTGVENVICKILDDHIPYELNDFLYDMESCKEEMDNWYTSLSDYLKKYSTSSVANQIKALVDSVLENLKDHLSPRRGYRIKWKEQLEALKKNIIVMRIITCVGTLLCTENQEFQCLLTHLEPLAISAAHLTLSLFRVDLALKIETLTLRVSIFLPKDLASMVSELLLKTNHTGNPLLHEKYTLALASLKHSRELCDSTLVLNDYPFTVKMEHCVVSLASNLWEMLQVVTRVSLKELELYDRLRLLRTLLKRQPDRFDDDRIRDLTAATVFDAGVRIFSLYQKDLVNDQCFQDNSEVIWAEVLEEKVVETLRFNFCKTNVLGFIDFLLESYLMEVNSSKVDSYSLSCVPKIRDHLVFLKSCMEKLAELRNQQENLHQDVWNLAVEVAYKIESLIDQLVLGDVLDSFPMSLQSITEYITVLKADSLNFFNDVGRQEIFKITWPSTNKVPSISSRPVDDEAVGFESEQALIINRLLGGFMKLQVVAVVGMAGLGKTTLATKVYQDSSVTHHFHVMAWCSISQVFDRRRVLLELLNQIQPGESNSTMNQDDLTLKLWRSLRQRRYLIFIDDIWDTEAFNLLKVSLPDDSTESRILLTSRHGDVVPEALLVCLPHLTVDESLVLLQRKLFPAQKDWPTELYEFGIEIAKYCKGLPLTVVIIAGLLKATEQEGWQEVLKTIRSSTLSKIKDECERTIELSYKHLPDHLKPCFLWFGAFPEDHEFSVKKMIWLWISEGLVRKNDSKSLEEVARDYMNHLIARSLVMNAEGRSLGGVKTCRIHDLLHDFCLRKANEEFSLHVLKVDSTVPRELFSGEFETLSLDETEILSSVELRNLRRLCIYSKPAHMKWKVFCPRLRSLLFFRPTEYGQELDLSYIFRMFKLLRVLGIDEVELTGFPSEIGSLVQLRYLAIQVGDFVGPAIGNLCNLETLIILQPDDGVVSLPDTVWNLQKLRHLHLNKYSSIVLPIDVHDSSCNLLELETLSALCVRDLSIMEKQLRKFPNIRQLKCGFIIDEDGTVNDSKVMDFSFLSQLESLSLLDIPWGTELIFPDSIKKLTLCEVGLSRNQIAIIAKLPNLEVLKLLWNEFLVGHIWHVEEGEFSKLKYLKLHAYGIVKWTAASDDLFPNLEKLVLVRCNRLEEIPECLENVATLEAIEVIDCPYRVARVVKKVVESQKEMGNSLQFHERGTLGSDVDLDFFDECICSAMYSREFISSADVLQRLG